MPKDCARKLLTVGALAPFLVSAIVSPAAAKDEGIPLDQVVKKTASIVTRYQNTSNGSTLPHLISADFDFRAVVDKQISGGISIFFFTIKVSKTTEKTSDVDFVYKLPPAGKTPLASVTSDATEDLLKTMQAAAEAVTKTPDFQAGNNTYNFCQLTTTIAFSVKYDGNGGVNVPFQLITVSAGGDLSGNNVQQIKLTFANPTPGKCS